MDISLSPTPRAPKGSLFLFASITFLASFSANAELVLLEDHHLAHTHGQAGLTIDIDTGLSIGEFMYKDAGSVVMQGIRFGGMNRCGDGASAAFSDGGSDAWCASPGVGEVGTAFGKQGANRITSSVMDPASRNDSDGFGGSGGTTGLNNLRLYIDVAGSGEVDGERIQPGSGSGPGNGNGNGGGSNPAPVFEDTYDNSFYWAWGDLVAGGPGLCGERAGAGQRDCEITLKDGDLFIHGSVSNPDIVERSYQGVDFGFEMDRFALKGNSYEAGDDISNPSGVNASDSTTLMSNLKMEGYFGGFDMLIENDGNGFGAIDSNDDGRIDQAESDAGTGNGAANSKIILNNFFEITEMEYDFDIVGIRIEKMAIHNHRGNVDMFDLDQSDFQSAANSQGFAQSNVQLYAVNNDILHVTAGLVGGTLPAAAPEFNDGIAFNTRLVADMDIAHLSFGDTGNSIGSLHWTDMDMHLKQTFSAH